MTIERLKSLTEARAQVVAAMAHDRANQFRKGSGLPYIVHPSGVVDILVGWGYAAPTMLAAAWLHDVVEDTDVTQEQVHNAFGAVISSMVSDLTYPKRDKSIPRADRVALNRAQLAQASMDAKIIRLADILHNSTDIVDTDPAFAAVWLNEKLLDLTVLRGTPAHLYTQVNVVLKNQLNRIPKDVR